MAKFSSMTMRKKNEKAQAPLFISQYDPTARGLPKVRGQITPAASRACVPRRGLERRKQGVHFQTQTYGPGSTPKQRRARESKLMAYGLSRKVSVQKGESQFDAMGLNVKQQEFRKQKMREVVNFVRDLTEVGINERRELAQATTEEARQAIRARWRIERRKILR